MIEALLYEKIGGYIVRCHTCQWYCVIHPEKSGVCKMYRNKDGILENLNYGLVSSMAVDPIEKKPLFHFHPGSRVLSLGGWGCNFHCRDCQNWEISMTGDIPSKTQQISPSRITELAKQEQCQGIAWTYNEPSVWFEYTLDGAKLAKTAGLYTIYVTNGYLSLEALDVIGPYLDAWRVDVKGFTDAFYQDLAKIRNWSGILEVTENAKNKWKMHVEVITNIIPTINDDEFQLARISAWIKNKLGADTPWHITRFYPAFNMNLLPPTPIKTLERAYDIGQKNGLRFIYIGNVPGHSSETTFCSACSQPVVERIGYDTNVIGLKGSACRFCGADLNFKTTKGGNEPDD